MPTIIPPSKAFAEFTIEHPWLTKKLINWARPYHLRANLPTNSQTQASMVESYLNDFIFNRSLDFIERDARLDNWVDKLSEVERRTLGKFFGMKLDVLSIHNEHSHWYFSRGEDYLVLHELVTECHHYRNQLIGVTTVNSYDAHILNTDRMLIVDVDLRSESSKPIIITDEKMALQTLRYAAEVTNTNWRVYRTAAGLRYFEISRQFEPGCEKTRQLQQLLYTDPLYVTLCRRQETFRARLTPKPWRSELCWRSEVTDYLNDEINSDDRAEAVCELIAIVGEQKILPMFAKLVEYHDVITKATPKHRREAQYQLT